MKTSLLGNLAIMENKVWQVAIGSFFFFNTGETRGIFLNAARKDSAKNEKLKSQKTYAHE
jgi:hypothetical protein